MSQRRAAGKQIGIGSNRATAHFRDDGKPKRGYDTKDDAVRFVASLKARYTEPTWDDSVSHVYRCNVCARFHVGRARNRTAKMEKERELVTATGLELGERALVHQLGESWGPTRSRRGAIRGRGTPRYAKPRPLL